MNRTSGFHRVWREQWGLSLSHSHSGSGVVCQSDGPSTHSNQPQPRAPTRLSAEARERESEKARERERGGCYSLAAARFSEPGFDNLRDSTLCVTVGGMGFTGAV